MDSISPKTLKLKPAETYNVEMDSRGALGLQLLFRTDKDSIVTITKNSPSLNNSNAVSAGDSIKVVFTITAVNPGTATITFYETQPWNKNFKEIVTKQVTVQVANP